MMANNTTEECDGNGDTFEILLLSVYFVNVLIHSFGIYLLSELYKRNVDNLATLYLCSLSTSELVRNILKIIEGPIIRSKLCNWQLLDRQVTKKVFKQIRLMNATSIELFYYGSIFSLTLNRLFEILLNIRYPVYWNLQKGKKQLGLMWILGITLYVILAIVGITDAKALYAPILLIYIVLDITYVVVGVLTYVFIFKQYVSAVVPPHERRSSTAIPINRFKIFRQSRFFLCAILIGKFLLLVAVSDLTYYFVCPLDPNCTAVNQICLTLSDLTDAMIYIFLDQKVKELMKRQFRRVRHSRGRFHCDWRTTNSENETGF